MILRRRARSVVHSAIVQRSRILPSKVIEPLNLAKLAQKGSLELDLVLEAAQKKSDGSLGVLLEL